MTNAEQSTQSSSGRVHTGWRRVILRHLTAWMVALVTAFGVVAYAPGAHAQGAKDQLARQLYKRGDLRYSAGQYESAARDFERAYELSGRSALLYNLANVYEKLKRYDDALRSLRAYLPTAPVNRKVEVEARIVKLEPLVSDQRAAGPKPPPKPITVPVPVPVPVPVKDPPSKPMSTEAIAGWSLVGVGGASLVLGGVMGGLALGKRREAADQCPAIGDTHRCPDSAQSVLDDDTTFSLVADIGFVLGAAGVGTGVALLVIDAMADDKEEADKPKKTGVDASVSLAPTTNGGWVMVRGTF